MSRTYYFSADEAILNDPFFKEFNILFRNALQSKWEFRPFYSTLKTPYPMNTWYDDEKIVFEIPILKGKSEDIEITKTSTEVRVKYTRSDREEVSNRVYGCRGIVERDFDFVWKLPNKINHVDISGKYADGLLTISLPFNHESLPEKVAIQ